MNWRTAAIGRAVCLVASVTVITSTSVWAQNNSWTSPTSAKWEGGTNWSLGVPPGASQTISVTNHGFKAVDIDKSTAVNFPQTMSIGSLTVITPDTGSGNLLLMNFAGLQTPLAVNGGLYVGNNADLNVLASALQQTNGTFEVGGTVTEDDSSQVSTEFFQIDSNGIYNLLSGGLTVPRGVFETVGPGGQFNLGGGSNFCYALQIDGGVYAISNGQLVLPPPGQPEEGILDTGNMIQSGGTLNSALSVGESGVGGGTYQLSGGLLNTIDLELPVMSASAEDTTPDSSFVIQTGGTNVAANMDMGVDEFGDPRLGVGTYLLTNGLLASSGLTINAQGNFYQYGGVHSNGLMILSQSELMVLVFPFTNYFAPAHYYLNGGTFTSGEISDQFSVFSQTAGTSQITTLGITGAQYTLIGGQLTVSNMGLSSGGTFSQTGGTVTQSGTLTLSDSAMTAGNGTQQFGELLLSTGGNTNSTLTLASGASVLHFINSSSLLWSNAAMLLISNWNGSTSGGGEDQIFFGNNGTGLTAQKLSQIEFINPSGLGPGTYSAQILPDGEIVPAQGSSGSGLVNSWINPKSGNWDQPTNWSLDILPASSQSVMITNAGFKAVAINPSTPTNFPGSMTVSNLTITAPTNSDNLLLLNFFGTNVPLTVLDGLTLRDNSQILDFNSGLLVEDGSVTVSNAQINQDGGFIITTNAPMSLQDSSYNLTNGLFEGGQVSLGNSVSAQFNQFGGSALISNLIFGTSTGGGTSGGGTYSLVGGNLNLPGGLTITGADDSKSAYSQSGGTNVTTSVFLEPGIFGISPSFTLSGGLLADSNVTLEADNFGGITLTQNGGIHFITNNLSIAGAAASSTQVNPGVYQLTGGQLTVSNMSLSGGASFSQTGGTVTQTGTLTIDSSSITAGNGTQQFGKLLLSGSTNSSLTLDSGASVLHFANSTSEAWSSGAMLLVSNWNGSLSGGGEDQIFFGSDSTGLTAQQLSQIKFINPAGLASGTYSARILSDGEVVPNQAIAASIAFSRQGNNLVLTWPAGWTLLSATNVVGPYIDVTNATSPDTISMTLPQQFFRLQKQ